MTLRPPHAASRPSHADGTGTYDVVIHGGRVIDPESGLDGVRDVGIRDGRIAAVSATALDGRREIDAKGRVVSAGFIDLHSHAQAVAEQRLQACDGVTTALELESGVAPISSAYAAAAAEGRPINYGYSTSWAALRMHVVAGQPLTGGQHGFQHGLGSQAWRSDASPRQTGRMLEMLESELADGAIGIGILLGYSPGTDPAEYVRVAQVAASHGVPAFTHARPLVEQDPSVVVDGAEEIARVAGETGAHLHFCHINSTSTRHLDRVHATVQRARSEGAAVTSEVYPYGAGMTGIGSDYFHPDRLHVLGATGTTKDVVYARTGETVASIERLLEIRAADPSGLAFIASFDELRFPDRVAGLLALPGAVVASDAVPFIADAGHVRDPLAWPPPPFVRTHPRGAGTYARTFRVAVRESGVLTLAEALAKCSLHPAQILEQTVPAMRRKGRVQVGCDADLVIFDPDRITDTATYRHSVRPSQGIDHVIVNGVAVVHDGRLCQDVMPGLPVRAAPDRHPPMTPR